MALCFTGHRQIDGQYEEVFNPSPDWIAVFNKTVEVVHGFWQRGHTDFISGGALGFDQVAAQAVIRLKNQGAPLRLTMALPFEGFELKWRAESKTRLAGLIGGADEVIYVCDPGYAAWKLHKRNEWMVDNSIGVIALYLPDKPGGTLNCIRYTMSVRKPLFIIHPLTQEAHRFTYNETLGEYIATLVKGGGVV